MKKLPFLTLFWLFAAIGAPAAGQALDNPGNQAALHEARFHVYDFETRAVIPGAGVYDMTGKQLGSTDRQGELVLKLPAESTQPYTVKAEGYDPMAVRLTQASKSTSVYDVFLPKAESGKQANRTPSSDAQAPDLVKVYVKQDPNQIRNIPTDQNQPVEFAVQLSATSRPITDKTSLKTWQEIGPVFIHSENGLYKVRIGPFDSQEGAKQVLLQVKARGKKDAFIVVQKGIENHIPFDPDSHYNRAGESAVTGMQPAPVPATTMSAEEESTIEYKVRLVSYLKPGGFNTTDVDQYGPLESYRKGEWTILMIGGFTSMAEAERVREKVAAKGFKDASVVTVRDGLLELDH